MKIQSGARSEGSTGWGALATRLSMAGGTLFLVLIALRTVKAQDTTTYSVVYAFNGGSDGANPQAGLVVDAAGSLYGVTPLYTGADGFGTAFKVDTSGKETVLHTFTDGLDGGGPVGSLVVDAAGNVYGTTSQGSDGYGVVFKLDPAGNETVLHSFASTPDGATPEAGLVRDGSGNLYGTTAFGGAFGFGTVFKLNPAGNETVLYSFAGSPTDGKSPYATVVRDASGNLYGTTAFGGAFGIGTVFELDTTGKETVLHSFTGPDGQIPTAPLVRDSVGNLYGTTSEGGGGSRPGVGFQA